MNFPDVLLADLRARLAQVRWPNAASAGWQLGTDQVYLRELLTYWAEGFDWARQQAQLNAFAQFRTTLPAGENLHFIHERGKGPRPLPLLLSHGWPDSFYRFYKLIPLLTDPAAHGGRVEDAFDVVVPSLPGFAFSDPVPPGSYYRQTATRLHALMGQLGYARYGTHGGDVGSLVAERLALTQPAAQAGMHLTNLPYVRNFAPPADPSAEEQAYFQALQQYQFANGSYVRQQITKPFSLTPGLADSPAGLAAWVVEKFAAWSDCDGQVEKCFSKDELLTNLMLYWGPNTIGSSLAPYYEGEPTPQGWGQPKREVPTGFALFPRDGVVPPRTLAERFYDVRQWTLLPRGGHFAALEEPELLAEATRNFFRPLRDSYH